jgi:TetR/AcrR family transcriptional regulator, transcriptional repressor for nem operon
MGRPSTAGDRLLAAACALMRERSYATVGVADICARADVRKGSFYHFFPSKQALTLAAIDIHWAEQRATWLTILTADEPPLRRLRRLFDHTAEAHRQARDAAGAVPGSVLANLALELSNQDQLVQRRLQEVFAEQIALVEGLLHEAAEAGEVPGESAGTRIARAVVAQMEGMVLFAKLGNDPDVLADLWTHTLLLVRAEPDGQQVEWNSPPTGSVAASSL